MKVTKHKIERTIKVQRPKAAAAEPIQANTDPGYALNGSRWVYGDTVAGKFVTDAESMAGATRVTINNVDADGNDLGELLNTYRPFGHLRIQERGQVGTFHVYEVGRRLSTTEGTTAFAIRATGGSDAAWSDGTPYVIDYMHRGPAGIGGGPGASGASGGQGPTGPEGPTGSAGADGSAGSDGADGRHGGIGLNLAKGTVASATVFTTDSNTLSDISEIVLQDALYDEAIAGDYISINHADMTANPTVWAYYRIGSVASNTYQLTDIDDGGGSLANGQSYWVAISAKRGLQGIQGNTGATGSTGATGAAGAEGIPTGLPWLYSAGGIGAAGEFEANSANVDSITTLSFFDENEDQQDLSGYLGSVTTGDHVKLTGYPTTFDDWGVYLVTGTSTPTNEHSYTVTLVSGGGGAFANGQTVYLSFSKKGAAGSTGAAGPAGPTGPTGTFDDADIDFGTGTISADSAGIVIDSPSVYITGDIQLACGLITCDSNGVYIENLVNGGSGNIDFSANNTWTGVNTYTNDLTIDGDETDVLTLINTATATTGNHKESPILEFEGNYFVSAASRNVRIKHEMAVPSWLTNRFGYHIDYLLNDASQGGMYMLQPGAATGPISFVFSANNSTPKSNTYLLQLCGSVNNATYMQIVSTNASDEGFFFGQEDASSPTGNACGAIYSCDGPLMMYACADGGHGTYVNSQRLYDTKVEFTPGGSVEATVSANTLLFNNGASDTGIDWTTNGTGKLFVGSVATTKLAWSSTGVSVTGALDVSGDLTVGGSWTIGNLTIGSGAAGVDYTLTFNGESADCVVTWMEDEGRLNFGSHINLGDDKALLLGTGADINIQYDDGDNLCIFQAVTDSASFAFWTDSLFAALYINGSDAAENIALVAASEPNWQSMDRGLFIGNAASVPSGNPSSGGFLYVESGALKYRGSSGTVTTIANA